MTSTAKQSSSTSSLQWEFVYSDEVEAEATEEVVEERQAHSDVGARSTGLHTRKYGIRTKEGGGIRYNPDDAILETRIKAAVSSTAKLSLSSSTDKSSNQKQQQRADGKNNSQPQSLSASQNQHLRPQSSIRSQAPLRSRQSNGGAALPPTSPPPVIPAVSSSASTVRQVNPSRTILPQRHRKKKQHRSSKADKRSQRSVRRQRQRQQQQPRSPERQRQRQATSSSSSEIVRGHPNARIIKGITSNSDNRRNQIDLNQQDSTNSSNSSEEQSQRNPAATKVFDTTAAKMESELFQQYIMRSKGGTNNDKRRGRGDSTAASSQSTSFASTMTAQDLYSWRRNRPLDNHRGDDGSTTLAWNAQFCSSEPPPSSSSASSVATPDPKRSLLCQAPGAAVGIEGGAIDTRDHDDYDDDSFTTNTTTTTTTTMTTNTDTVQRREPPPGRPFRDPLSMFYQVADRFDPLFTKDDEGDNSEDDDLLFHGKFDNDDDDYTDTTDGMGDGGDGDGRSTQDGRNEEPYDLLSDAIMESRISPHPTGTNQNQKNAGNGENIIAIVMPTPIRPVAAMHQPTKSILKKPSAAVTPPSVKSNRDVITPRRSGSTVEEQDPPERPVSPVAILSNHLSNSMYFTTALPPPQQNSTPLPSATYPYQPQMREQQDEVHQPVEVPVESLTAATSTLTHRRSILPTRNLFDFVRSMDSPLNAPILHMSNEPNSKNNTNDIRPRISTSSQASSSFARIPPRKSSCSGTTRTTASTAGIGFGAAPVATTNSTTTATTSSTSTADDSGAPERLHRFGSTSSLSLLSGQSSPFLDQQQAQRPPAHHWPSKEKLYNAPSLFQDDSFSVATSVGRHDNRAVVTAATAAAAAVRELPPRSSKGLDPVRQRQPRRHVSSPTKRIKRKLLCMKRIVEEDEEEGPICEEQKQQQSTMPTAVNDNGDSSDHDAVIEQHPVASVRVPVFSSRLDAASAAESMGPNSPITKSLYSYDNVGQQQIVMDVVYHEFCQPLSIRQHLSMPQIAEGTAATQVVVQVEASSVSYLDCAMRRGEIWTAEEMQFPAVPGMSLVGKVVAQQQQLRPRMSKKYGLLPNDTVLTLLSHGGANARYAFIDASHAVRLPPSVSPAQAVCLPETYLPAFQALHFGQSGTRRYRSNSLRGKSLLILGVMSNPTLGKALIELAFHACTGAVYATAKNKHWRSLIEQGVTPLSPDARGWILRLEGAIDLMIATDRDDVTPTHLKVLARKRGREGHLVQMVNFCGKNEDDDDSDAGNSSSSSPPSPTSASTLLCARARSLVKANGRTCSTYHLLEAWERDLSTCKKDLDHLATLLDAGAIDPVVLDRVPLSKVSRAHELLSSEHRFSGHLVCEPWLRSKKRAAVL